MNSPLSLQQLGPRICIMGPSNSGKSTLADAISRKTAIPVVHLDQLYHLPDTNWILREPAEFFRLHSLAVNQESWVIEGNYTKCIDERLARATGMILLDVPVTVALLRYIRRCYSSAPRLGALRSGRENAKWQMIKFITRVAPQNHLRHRVLYDRITLPKLLLRSPQEVNRCFKSWDLGG